MFQNIAHAVAKVFCAVAKVVTSPIQKSLHNIQALAKDDNACLSKRL